MNSKTTLIIVLYYPKWDKLIRTLDSLKDLHVVLVDNTPDEYKFENSCNNFYIPLKENKGIAYAQNIGIDKAKDINATHVVFFDQDSVIEPEYVNKITAIYKSLSKEKKIGILGPIVIREKNEEEYKSIFYNEEEDEEQFIAKSHIISSGSCISMQVLDIVGKMDARLFIDYVDYEWCWRAKLRGYMSGITTRVTLKHNVGVSEIHFGKYIVIVSSPIRYFYQYRNYLWLCRRNYVPSSWKRNTGLKFLLRIFYFPFMVKNRWKIEKYIWRGICAGLKNYPQ